MLTTFERPLTDAQRHELQAMLGRFEIDRPAMLSRLIRWTILWAVGLAGIIGTQIWINRQGATTKVAEVLSLAATIACVLGATGIFRVLSKYRRERREAFDLEQQQGPMIRAALADGHARVQRVEASGVIEIAEEEDEQSAFIYDLGDGTCLYLRGEHYYLDAPEDTPWPARRFELVHTVKHHIWLGVENQAEQLEPLEIVPMSEMPSDYVTSETPATETIMPGTPLEVLAKLRER